MILSRITSSALLLLMLVSACEKSSNKPANASAITPREDAAGANVVMASDAIRADDARAALAPYLEALARIDQPGGAAAAYDAAVEVRWPVARLLETIEDDSTALDALRRQLPGIEMHWSPVSVKVWPIAKFFARHAQAREEQEYLAVADEAYDDYGLPVWEELYTDETSVLNLQAVDTTGIARRLWRAADANGAYKAQLQSMLEALLRDLERPCGHGANDVASLRRILVQFEGSTSHAKLSELYALFIRGEQKLEECRAG